MKDFSEFIDFSREAAQAQKDGKPIVAIETAGTFENFSYPLNIQAADLIMDEVRKEGAVPAYIGIIGGKIKVGLDRDEAEYLAHSDRNFIKASRRDIPMLLAKKSDALTSVAATMMIADMAGISVVTGGGIGGVHRGVQTSFDISADLQEFCKSSVIVVCSGIKSILDLKLTMEYLETHSAAIAGYRTNELPAYMAIHSGCRLDYSFDAPKQAADCFNIQRKLGMKGSLLVANPISEQYAVDFQQMELAINKAVDLAEKNGIHGKIITKYIMDIVKQEMGDDSVEASIQMNIQNAGLAAQIACEL